MLINNKRALAYIATLDEIKPIAAYDRVEYGRVNGWWCIISKENDLKVGDKVVYFEVDSKVPADDERFAFLEKRHYMIKTLKMCKVISQGLIMPLTAFPELANREVGEDVTDDLRVEYCVDEDNLRKNDNPDAKYIAMSHRHKKTFKKKWAKWMMKRKWGRNVMFFFFGKKKDRPKNFPSFISKTDEERIENKPWLLEDSEKQWIMTEKLDGTSCTYALERKSKNKFEFYVCSRNMRLDPPVAGDPDNIYWKMALEYKIEERMLNYLRDNPEDQWVCIQGEGVGKPQGNPLKLKSDDLFVFNFITSSLGRVDSRTGEMLVRHWGLKWVPILGLTCLPKDMQEMKKMADGKSVVNPAVSREGIVYRSIGGKESFKNVSTKYLMEKNK